MQQNNSPEIDPAILALDEEELKRKRRYERHKTDNLALFITQLYEPGKPPSAANLFPVRCKDFSCGGFSFWFPTRPNFRRLVVRLGNHDNPLYMEVEIVHTSPVKEPPRETVIRDADGGTHKITLGSTLFHVGCRFVHRIPAPSAS